MLKICPECQTEVSSHAQACPKCAFPIQSADLDMTNKTNKWPVIYAVIAGVISTAMFMTLLFIFVLNKQVQQNQIVSTPSIQPSVIVTASSISNNELKAKEMELEIEKLKLEQEKIKKQPLSPPNTVYYVNAAAPVIQVTEDELYESSCKGLWILRNSIYARYGRIFQDREVRSYFQAQSWYQPNRAYSDALLSANEKATAARILAAEKRAGCL